MFVAGALCGAEIDECLPTSIPCKNNAECRNTNGSFVCICPTGYTGRLCDVNRNDYHLGMKCLALQRLGTMLFCLYANLVSLCDKY